MGFGISNNNPDPYQREMAMRNAELRNDIAEIQIRAVMERLEQEKARQKLEEVKHELELEKQKKATEPTVLNRIYVK